MTVGKIITKKSNKRAALAARAVKVYYGKSLMNNKSLLQIDKAYKDIQTILEKARSKSFKAVNAAMVQAYWHIGKVILEEEQRGKQRAEYGKSLLEGLSGKLSREYGEGFNITNLKYMHQFYLAFPIRHALRGELTWTKPDPEIDRIWAKEARKRWRTYKSGKLENSIL